MTDDQIETQLKDLIQVERKTTTEILKLINLAEGRDLPLKRGFGSTFDWLTKGLGYSSSAAWRRLQSARLMRAVPRVEAHLESGEINLTNLAKAQQAIRASEKANRQKMNDTEKANVIDAIAGQNTTQTEATLLELLPETASTVHQERIKQINEDHTRLMFNFSKDEMEHLAWAVDYLSHVVPHGAHGRVLAKVLIELKKLKEKAATSKAQRKQCEYVDERTGRQCKNTFQIEDDHIVPRALGGPDEESNLRCLCRAHNQMMAREWLGKEWASAFTKRKGPGPMDRDIPDDGNLH